ncbi:hypothetical protein G7054_g5142 [Neopestalotiopsis clavispora]|nr:hypothetical protein G7054_g5142 [Neopestalotiopsis clavispora]
MSSGEVDISPSALPPTARGARSTAARRLNQDSIISQPQMMNPAQYFQPQSANFAQFSGPQCANPAQHFQAQIQIPNPSQFFGAQSANPAQHFQAANPAHYFNTSPARSKQVQNDFRIMSEAEVAMLEKQILVEFQQTQSVVGRPVDLARDAITSSQRSMNECDEAFQYECLVDASNMLRILVVQPSQDHTEPIRVRLEPANLDSDSEYEAISYVWGTRTNDARVIHESAEGSRYIQVPSNLYTALCHLRRQDQPRKIWADAICINQSDEAEKGEQVAIMRRIFQHASRLVIWLGVASANHYADGLFEFLEYLAHMRNVQNNLESGEIIQRMGDHFKAVELFFALAWFQRIWCLQEVTLARKKIVLHWGSSSTSWDGVANFTTWLARVLPSGFVMHENAKVGLRNASLMDALRRSTWETPSERCSYLELLAMSRMFSATDARDKVFALLGIPTTDADVEQGALFLMPNYAQSLDDVYLTCARRIIEASGDFAIFSHVQHGDGAHLEEHESWVPYWNSNFSRPIALVSRPSKGFSAAGSYSSHHISSSPWIDGQLIAYGCQISVIQNVSTIIERDAPTFDPGGLAGNIWNNFIRPLRIGSSDANILFELCFLITAGKDSAGHIVPDDGAIGHFADFAACIYKSGRPRAGASSDFDLVQSTKTAQLELGYYGQLPRGQNFKQAFVAACTQRRIFSGDNGYLGLGPRITQPGDFVCLLAGATTPIILRPCDKGYKVIGESYVFGIMQGEAWNECEAERRGSKDIRDEEVFDKFVLL